MDMKQEIIESIYLELQSKAVLLFFSVASHPPIEEALVNTAKARGVPLTPPNTRSLRYCMPKKIGILFIGLKLRKFQIRRISFRRI